MKIIVIMVIVILLVILGILCWACVYVGSKTKERLEQNESLKKNCDILKDEQHQLQIEKNVLKKHLNELQDTLNSLAPSTEQAIKNQQETIEKAVNELKARQQELSLQLEVEYADARQDFEDEYIKMVNDSVAEYDSAIASKQDELKELYGTLDNIYQNINKKRSEYQIFCETLKTMQKDKDEQNFYKLQLTTADIEEVQKLKAVATYLRNPESLYKAIYKTYYENAYTDMVGRVIGTGHKCGIYRITNTTNGMTYVGQSVDISERWRQHIKAGLGIGSSNNKLYSAMKTDGVENFTFNILEECPRDRLNDQEKYWIAELGTNSWGYNMTGGGS